MQFPNKSLFDERFSILQNLNSSVISSANKKKLLNVTLTSQLHEKMQPLQMYKSRLLINTFSQLILVKLHVSLMYRIKHFPNFHHKYIFVQLKKHTHTQQDDTIIIREKQYSAFLLSSRRCSLTLSVSLFLSLSLPLSSLSPHSKQDKACRQCHKEPASLGLMNLFIFFLFFFFFSGFNCSPIAFSLGLIV